METIRGGGDILQNIDLAPENTYQEVVQNIKVILVTVQKSIPMMRGLGIPGEVYGRPLSVVKNMLVGEIYGQIEEYEPRAVLGEIYFEGEGIDGEIVPVITLEGVRE